MKKRGTGRSEESRPGVLYIEHGASYGGAIVSLLQTVEHCRRTRPIVVTFRPLDEMTAIKPASGVRVFALRSFSDYSRKARFLRWARRVLGEGGGYKTAAKGYALLDVFNSYYLVFRLARIAKRESARIIHCNNNMTLLCHRLAKYTGLPVIYHFRGPDDFTSMKEEAAHAAAHIVISSALKRLYSSQLEMDLEQFHKIPDPVSIAPFESKESLTRAESLRLELEEPDPLVVSIIGRVNSFKGQGVLIEALRPLMIAHGNLHLWVVGDGADMDDQYFKRLVMSAKSADLGGRVRFWGFQGDVAPFILASDIVVNASVGQEGFGRSIVEGFAAKKPVITTAIGGPLDLVEHGHTGLLVEPSCVHSMRAALVQLIENPKLREALGKRGYRFVRENLGGREAARRIEAVQLSTLARGACQGQEELRPQ